ncbi:uncharacterized protein [Dermacentor albipictus]|uniref:uncharacterized protein n=1 Tax=Dermacentor albipictus TaxID=60249 RepID=UPI0038FCC80F
MGSAFPFSTALLKRTQRAPALLYGQRYKRLLRPQASAVPGATTTASTLARQWRPAGRLDLSPRPALLLVLHSSFQLWSSSLPSVPLHYSTVSATKDYLSREHHLFQERILLLLHYLALHYYWCCAPVFDSGGYFADPCTSTLRSALKEITSGASISRSMCDCYCFYILSRTASCWQTGLSLAPLHLILVPSVCRRLWRKRNVPARSFPRKSLALPHEQPSSARSSCRVI